MILITTFEILISDIIVMDMPLALKLMRQNCIVFDGNGCETEEGKTYFDNDSDDEDDEDGDNYSFYDGLNDEEFEKCVEAYPSKYLPLQLKRQVGCTQ